MAGPKLTEAQWGDIRTQWIATDRAVREIAREFGVSDTAVNKRASKEGWGPRNAPARKRALVAGAAAGLQKSLQTKPNQSPAELAILEAAQLDIEDMDLALSVGQKLLRRCAKILDAMDIEVDPGDPMSIMTAIKLLPPKDLASLASTWKMTVEGIRKIRGLDEPTAPADFGNRTIRLIAPDGAEVDLGRD